MSRTTSVVTGSLEVPGARLHYEVRGDGPVVALVGAPMGAASFVALADLLAVDHTVVTTDPRGVNRSPLDDPEQDSTPQLRADDLSRLLAHLGAAPAVVVGSSGGAVTALAMAQAHPERVHTIVAHEPPVSELLDDREQVLASTDDLIATYLAGDVLGAWAKFMAQAAIALPDAALEQMFGGERPAQVVADEHHWFAHEMRETILFRPDIAVLRAAPTRIVVGVGEQSTGQICDRTSAALAAALGIEPTPFPGGHTGFVDAPDLFATRLRTVLYG
jgi:pimeloyl-ACP methyl ester carboxylesterase